MSFGGLGGCLPLRLGRGDDAGIAAEAHARMCADLVAAHRTMPVASMTIAVDTLISGTATVVAYVGRNGSGLQYAPAVSIVSGALRVHMSATANALGSVVDLMPYTLSGFAVTRRYLYAGDWIDAAMAYTPADTLLRFTTPSAVNTLFQIDIYGADSLSTFGDYGGHVEKHDSTTENGTTYAWQWYEYLKVAQGSAYSTSDTSVRAWGLKAEARALGTSQRHTEMLAASASPGCADAKLALWATVLGVQQAGRSKAAVRDECEARGRAAEAPTTAYLTTAIADILGTKAQLDGIVHPLGTMGAWPDATYWPGYINGPGSLDMGGGMWSSSRFRVTLQITPLGGVSNEALTDIMSRDIAAFMSRTLPAVDEWAWDIAGGAGFELDSSSLDLTAL